MADLLSNACLGRIAERLAARIDDEGVLDFPPRPPLTPEEARGLGVEELTRLVKESAMELAIGQRLTERDLTDPVRLRQTEAAMLQGMEHRRRYEEWASGKRYWLQHQGFRRIDDEEGPALECRATLMEGSPTHSVAFRSPEGYAVNWTGSEADRERIGKDLPAPAAF